MTKYIQTDELISPATLNDLVEQSKDHAERHDYNIDSYDIAETCIDESAQLLGFELNPDQRAIAIQALLSAAST